MPTDEERELFKELANKVLILKKEAERHGTAEDARLGMQGTAAWAYAYRIIFTELEPKIKNTGIWMYYLITPGSCFVDDVLNYVRAIQNELDKMDSYRGYYGHI